MTSDPFELGEAEPVLPAAAPPPRPSYLDKLNSAQRAAV